MKLNFNLNENLCLKNLEPYNVIKVVRSIFHLDNKNYPQVFSDEC